MPACRSFSLGIKHIIYRCWSPGPFSFPHLHLASISIPHSCFCYSNASYSYVYHITPHPRSLITLLFFNKSQSIEIAPISTPVMKDIKKWWDDRREKMVGSPQGEQEHRLLETKSMPSSERISRRRRHFGRWTGKPKPSIQEKEPLLVPETGGEDSSNSAYLSRYPLLYNLINSLEMEEPNRLRDCYIIDYLDSLLIYNMPVNIDSLIRNMSTPAVLGDLKREGVTATSNFRWTGPPGPTRTRALLDDSVQRLNLIKEMMVLIVQTLARLQPGSAQGGATQGGQASRL